MCALRHIRSSLPDEVAKMVTCSIISSRLDYCNSLLVGMSDNNFAKLQRVQNSLARVVTGTKRYDHVKREVVHITPVLAQLHWLPVKARVSFKLASLVYNIRQSNTPKYLASYLVGHQAARYLRHCTVEATSLLKVATTKLKTSSKAFSHAAPKLWTSLPLSVTDCVTVGSFRKNLKTYLYNTAYST